MQKAPLYRKVNTTARGVRHNFGGEFRHDRHSKEAKASEKTRTSMGGKAQRGLDYTPLFRFLISKIGQDWTQVHSEAVSRLDREEPIYRLVAKWPDQQRDFVCVGESSFFSGLFIDEANRLRAVNPEMNESSLYPYCKCCTHTFNGIRFTRPFTEGASGFFFPSDGGGAA
ncbi:hypothetical protein [Ideonella livida]|uniref:Uncharacterized protein n=1 Tax=Ideonella livida TaxID=2707176 RepID=A0A7C9PL17_9BURK|nr:hypothetical protein [Ideonella livida]NDY94054.1 hypothetical protein [Ideonella livida]